MMTINVLATQCPITGRVKNTELPNLFNPNGLFVVTKSERDLASYLPAEIPIVKSAPLSPRQLDMLMGKAPLRLVVKREAVLFAPNSHVPQYQLIYWIETLECGHKQEAHPSSIPRLEPTAVRRRCPECLIAAVKKPNQSVVLPREKRRIA